jgi:hypothetical protein
MRDRAIFVCGLDRSGKTYMRLMLDSHPHLALTRRTKLWSHFYGKFGPLAVEGNLDRCLAALYAHKHVRSLGIDFQRLRTELASASPTYPRLFALIHRQYAERQGKRRWGDQSELLESYAGRILAAFPAARFIHMTRDPRDRYLAVLRKSRRRGGVGAATARWLYSARLAQRNQLRYPQAYMLVRYESMVTDPEGTMREVSRFLDETYAPAMVEMAEVPRFRDSQFYAVGRGTSPLSPDHVGRFRGALSPRDVEFMQRKCGEYMRAFGYTLEQTPSSGLERVRSYALHWGINSLRMIGWQLQMMAAR